MSITIYHNPNCSASRNVLAILKATGAQPNVVAYLQTGWTEAQLVALFDAAGLIPRDALRTARSPAEELGLLDPSVTDDVLLKAMVEHPILVNRPIVSTPIGTRLCRPIETVLDLLEKLPDAPFIKEDGTPIDMSKRKTA